MSRMKTRYHVEHKIDQTPPILTEETPITTTNQSAQEPNKAAVMADCGPINCGQDCSSTSGNGSAVGASEERIEVCMGGKCKRSGGLSLRAVIEGGTVRCICLAKCRDGPNIRVQNRYHSGAVKAGEGSLRTSAMNPLCIGVALDDVGAILANFIWGEE